MTASPGVQSPGRDGRGHPRRLEGLLLAAAIAFPLVRFAVDVARGIDFLHYQYLVDDAFYYFVIARHIPFFNLGIPTTGFHPLYAFIASLFHGTLSPTSAVIACLAVLAAANAASIAVLHHTLTRLFPQPVPLIAALGWSVSAKTYALTMTGVETAIAVLVVLVFFDLFLGLVQDHAFDRTARVAALAFCAGLGFWARMDVPVLVAPACAYILLHALRARGFGAAAALVAITVLLPTTWMAIMWWLTGTALPTSGEAVRALASAQPGAETGLVAPLDALRPAVRYVAQYFAGSVLPGPVAGLIVGLLAAAALYVGLSGRIATKGRTAALGVLALVIGAGFALWTVYYAYHQETFRIWYGLYLAIPFYLLLVPVLTAALLASPLGRSGSTALATAIVLGVSLLSTGGPNAPQEYDKYHAILAANAYLDALPAGVRVGSFNTGIYDFYANADVLNLDGVVNPHAVEAHRQRDIVGYMQRSGVRYLIEAEDDNSFVWVRHEPGIRFEKWVDLAEEYEPYRGEVTARIYLWKVSYPSAPPPS